MSDYYGEYATKHFQGFDYNYQDLLKAMKSFDIKGVVVCESPNIEIDTKILADFYKSL